MDKQIYSIDQKGNVVKTYPQDGDNLVINSTGDDTTLVIPDNYQSGGKVSITTDSGMQVTFGENVSIKSLVIDTYEYSLVIPASLRVQNLNCSVDGSLTFEEGFKMYGTRSILSIYATERTRLSWPTSLYYAGTLNLSGILSKPLILPSRFVCESFLASARGNLSMPANLDVGTLYINLPLNYDPAKVLPTTIKVRDTVRIYGGPSSSTSYALVERLSNLLEGAEEELLQSLIDSFMKSYSGGIPDLAAQNPKLQAFFNFLSAEEGREPFAQLYPKAMFRSSTLFRPLPEHFANRLEYGFRLSTYPNVYRFAVVPNAVVPKGSF